jgi:hypothetical protein
MVEADLGFGVLPIAGTLWPQEQIVDLSRANDELTQ